MHILKGYTKQEISWMMYDWANSAHSVIIVTLLPIFFDTVAGYTADSVSSMSTWGYATSIAMLIVALAAPFLGVFGDIRGMRKKLFSFFMLLGVAACAGMAFTPFQGIKMADYAYQRLGYTKAAVIFQKGADYNEGLAENFVNEFESRKFFYAIVCHLVVCAG